MSLFDAVSGRVSVALHRAGHDVEVRRRGGGELAVPANETFTVESGETVRFTNVDTSAPGAEVIEKGTLVVDSERTNENIYGITTDDDAGEILLGTYRARRMYTGDDDTPDLRSEGGGKRETDTPVIAFVNDRVPQRVGQRIRYLCPLIRVLARRLHFARPIGGNVERRELAPQVKRPNVPASWTPVLV